jgi:hypothetical protein
MKTTENADSDKNLQVHSSMEERERVQFKWEVQNLNVLCVSTTAGF